MYKKCLKWSEKIPVFVCIHLFALFSVIQTDRETFTAQERVNTLNNFKISYSVWDVQIKWCVNCYSRVVTVSETDKTKPVYYLLLHRPLNNKTRDSNHWYQPNSKPWLKGWTYELLTQFGSCNLNLDPKTWK